jgi:hypothetical protein
MAREVRKMDEMIAFVRRYLADAFRVDRLGCLVDETYPAERIPVTRMWLHPSNGHPRVHVSDPEEQYAKRKLADLYVRHLFKASRYLHPDYGEIGVFVVSADERSWGLPGYRERYAVGRIPGETAKPRSEEPWVMKFLGDENGCNRCWCTGIEKDDSPRAGQICSRCHGRGWNPVRIDLSCLTTPLEVIRFEEPEDKRYLKAHLLDA